MTESFKNELYHHGVKGMKWGQHIFGDKYNNHYIKKTYPIKRREASKVSDDLLNKHNEYVNSKEFKKQQSIFNKYEDRYAKKIDQLYKKSKDIDALNQIVANHTVKDKARILKLNSKDQNRYFNSDAAMTKATQMKSNADSLKKYTARHIKNRYDQPEAYRILEEYKKKKG